MPLQALAAAATLLSFVPHGNRIELRLDHGSAEVVWISPSTFHFRRVLEGSLSPARDALTPSRDREGAVDIQTDDIPSSLRIRSQYIELLIEKQGVLLRA